MKNKVVKYYQEQLKKEETKKACILTSLSAVEYSISQIKLCISKAKQGL